MPVNLSESQSVSGIAMVPVKVKDTHQVRSFLVRESLLAAPVCQLKMALDRIARLGSLLDVAANGWIFLEQGRQLVGVDPLFLVFHGPLVPLNGCILGVDFSGSL